METQSNPRDLLGTIRAELATLESALDPRCAELLLAEAKQLARLHRVERPLGVTERRLKAGFDRMLNGFEGLEELTEVQLRMLVQEQFAARAPLKSRQCLAWVAAERGITDLCLTLYAGGADMAVLLEGAILGRRRATLEELLERRPTRRALKSALEVCVVADDFEAAQSLQRRGAPMAGVVAAAVALEKLNWVDQLLAWGAPAEAVLIQSAFDGNTLAITLALARGADPSLRCEGRLPSEIARFRGHLDAAALLSPRSSRAQSRDGSVSA